MTSSAMCAPGSVTDARWWIGSRLTLAELAHDVDSLASGEALGMLVLDAFAPFGVEREGMEQFGLVALNVPSAADISAVKRLLIQGAEEGQWHNEEGCVNPEWRATE
jgi:hypothetical protein